MTQEEYENCPGINISRLILGTRSMAHVRYALDNEQPDKSYFQFGRAVHLLVFQPELVMDGVGLKIDGRTVAGKKQTEQARESGRILLDSEDYAAFCNIREAVQTHPTLKPILNNPKAFRERAITWTDPTTQVACKGQLDFHDDDCVIDLKTCEDASPAGFAREIAKYHYHVKAAWYLDGLDHYLNDQLVDSNFPDACKGCLGPQNFLWIAVEKKPPHCVGIYSPGEYWVNIDILDKGRETYLRLLEQYRDCTEANRWPAYSEKIEPIQLPGWYGE